MNVLSTLHHTAAVARAAVVATAVALVLAGAALASRADAQPLPPKRTLTLGAAPGCVGAAPTVAAPTVRRDNAEARRLAAQGQEAALVGDQAAARDAFARAAALNPTDERIAYDLGRAHEELADSASAIGEYCRYLALSPQGRESSDVRARLARLVPRGAAQSAERIVQAFQLGISHYERGRFDAAITAFDDVVDRAPAAAEAYYNRALARSAAGRRAEALRDFETYLATAIAPEDRAAVVRAVDQLRRPIYDAATAFTRGLIVPGLGQFYTGRPGRGLLALSAVAGSVVFALQEKSGVRRVPYVDPNGVPVPYDESYTERPYLAAGAAAAVGIAVFGAFEASRYARATSRAAARARPSAGGSTQRSTGDVTVSPSLSPRAGLGLTFTARF